MLQTVAAALLASVVLLVVLFLVAEYQFIWKKRKMRTKKQLSKTRSRGRTIERRVTNTKIDAKKAMAEVEE